MHPNYPRRSENWQRLPVTHIESLQIGYMRPYGVLWGHCADVCWLWGPFAPLPACVGYRAS